MVLPYFFDMKIPIIINLDPKIRYRIFPNYSLFKTIILIFEGFSELEMIPHTQYFCY